MFGSKLRSWMENHIGRPRKKGTKNKNANGNVTTITAAGCSHDATYKKTAATGFTIYHGNGATNTATTPASITASSLPAACGAVYNHNGGCSSAISSPVRRREVSPIQNHTQSRYGWQSPDQETVTSPKSDNFLYAPQHHRVKAPHHTVPNSKDNSGEDKIVPQQQHSEYSSSSFSSLSWSTGSKEPSSNQGQPPKQSTSIVAQAEMHRISTPTDFLQLRRDNSNELHNSDEDPNVVHYEEIRTILRHPEHIINNNFVERDRPKSEQLSTFTQVRAVQENRSQDDASARYGRLLPSRMQTGLHAINGPGDSFNSNHMRGSSSIEYIPSNNNNSRNGTAFHYPPQSTAIAHAQRGGRLRNGRYVGNHGVSPSATGVAAAPLNSLSSPESAYSTGYSTDGTSPGAIYTPPEYYINMRTGTHYFPKSVNSLAIEAQRYKFGLNKIEEMSPIDPLPKTSFANAAGVYIQRSDICRDDAQVKIPSFCITSIEAQTKPIEKPQRPLHHPLGVGCHSPLALRNTIVLPTLKGFESPSPRQRCRIRTNPWYSTSDTSSSGTTMQPFALPPTSSSSTISSLKSACSATALRMEIDAGSTSSSGIKSSNDAEGAKEQNKHNGKSLYDSESESSSSLTEVENMQRTYSPNTIRRKRAGLLHHCNGPVAADLAGVLHPYCAASATVSKGSHSEGVAEFKDAVVVSDDDATLNEMMGKFDESYVYEKETDILSSDSDPTDCPSDLDTGQDAGDECDTDELLDIDFIDTSSMQEIYDKQDMQSNLGSCYYYSNSPGRLPKQQMDPRASVRSRRKFSQELGSGAPPAACGSQRRRKRFFKTRKKGTESREYGNSPFRKSRESRSVGGTPVCLRRNHSSGKERIYKTSPLSNRSSSLVFTEVRESRFMTIAESEKALLKADLEADVKYRQLILEAESILVSMKNSTQSIPRDTPVASPRRINPLANKRVEMLKNCEVETKRELAKQQAQRSADSSTHAEQELAAAINRRIELLKYETTSAPNSPKFCRLSPRKTHLTNFMQQNTPPEVPPRKSASSECPTRAPHSPQLQLNGRRMQSQSSSPQNRRRFRSQSAHLAQRNYATLDSDSENDGSMLKQLSGSSLRGSSCESIRNVHINGAPEDVINHSYLPEFARVMMLYDGIDLANRSAAAAQGTAGKHACPQSEPLKRKVYKGSSTFERIKKSFDLESEIPKQAMLAKIHHLRRRERQNSPSKTASSVKSSSHDLNQSLSNIVCAENSAAGALNNDKKQLILTTIADLKRSLESQSVELNGLNED